MLGIEIKQMKKEQQNKTRIYKQIDKDQQMVTPNLQSPLMLDIGFFIVVLSSPLLGPLIQDPCAFRLPNMLGSSW